MADKPARTKESYRENAPRLDRLEAMMAADPEQATKLIQQLLGKVLIPHSDGQREVLTSDTRFLTLDAGRRWGKTKVGAAKALRRARRENQMIWWVAPTYKVVKRGYAEVLRQLPDNVLSKTAPAETSFDAGRSVVLRFKNGTRMEFYSAERPEAMLGEGVDFAVLDEAATMPETVWTQIVRPTLADRQGAALFISTPRGKNWFYDLYVRGQDELQHNYASWKFESFTNPTIEASEWEEMETSLPRAIYEQEVLADFLSNAASVFRLAVEGSEVGGRILMDAVQPIQPPQGHVILGIDLAKHNDFTVIDGVNAGNKMPSYHERFNAVSWPEQRRRIHTAVDNILETASGITICLDSTGVGDVVYDDLSFEGLDCVPIKFTQQWKQQAVMLLGADVERNQAFIHEAQRVEFEGYSYKINEQTGRFKFEAAGSGHDDEVSARLLSHWGLVNMGVPDMQMISGPARIGAGGYDQEEIIEGEVVEEIIYADSPAEIMANPDAWG